MAKALVITEKPSVALDISRALGGFREEDGYYENDAYVVTFALGHLYELLPPEEVDEKYKSWTLDALPILPESFGYRPKQGQRDRLKTIRQLLHRDDVDRVVNACDAGREGELIFREIVENLDSDKQVERLWLQSMTETAIRRGFDDLRPGEELEGLAAAARCRAQSDWLIGMNATRALTKRLKSRKEKTAWSAGRVQTPTLSMLVERELLVLAHVPRPFWRIEASFEHQSNTYKGDWYAPDFEAGSDAEAREDRFFDEERATAVVARVIGQPAKATETRKPSRESAPPLFDLTSLQREGNRRLGWSARRTLSAAQRLYERHKLLTYPRTDSRCLPTDYRSVVDETLSQYAGSADVEGFADYAESAARLIENGLENTQRVFDDEAVSDHFAIVPTGSIPEAPLTGDDARLFDLVVRRFLGTFHPPARWERVERITTVAGEHFRTRDRFLQEPGWRAVLPKSEETAERLEPLVGDGDSQTLEATSIAEETKPPPRITEARLLSLMENAGKQIDDEDYAAAVGEKGIGTPATRADVIENLIAKGYAVRIDKALRPSVKGIRLIDTLHRIHIERLTSPELTGHIEHNLAEVEAGNRTSAQFMSEITEYASEIVDVAKTFEYEELYDLNEPLGPCPSCKRPVIEMAWFYRCMPEPDVEQEDDCPMRFWKDTSGRYLDRQAVAAMLRDGKTGTLDGFTARSGRTYKGYIEILEDEWKLKVRSLGWNTGEGVSDQPDYDVNPEPLSRCPFQEECAVLESPKQFLCERTLKAELRAEGGEKAPEGGEQATQDGEAPQGCGFVLPRTVCKREITRDEAQPYVSNGKTELLTDFTSRFGRPFSATLVLKENGRHGFEFQPRGKAAGGAGGKTSKKKTTKKKATKKKTKKKATKKKTTKKKATKKKTTKKKAAKKKTTKKTVAEKKAPGKKAAAKKKTATKAETEESGATA
ncbi:DNA topoisomerase [Myxococcota bacterium]|nr:DNA topoisomerase [Myxococcota bacterium]